MIITLTTDWGHKDFYLAAIKGAILNGLPSAQIVDISHEIPRHDTLKTAFVLSHSFTHFPPGTVHMIGVAAIPEGNAKHLAVLYKGHYFLGADNGLFSLIMDDGEVQIVELSDEKRKSNFPMLEVFLKPALALASGTPFHQLGKTRDGVVRSLTTKPSYDANILYASVVYMDQFENAITNVSKSLFEEVRKGRKFIIYIRKFSYNIETINTTYNDVPPGEIVAFFNTLDLLEIAINQGKAGGLLGIKYREQIRIEFHD